MPFMWWFLDLSDDEFPRFLEIMSTWLPFFWTPLTLILSCWSLPSYIFIEWHSRPDTFSTSRLFLLTLRFVVPSLTESIPCMTCPTFIIEFSLLAILYISSAPLRCNTEVCVAAVSYTQALSCGHDIVLPFLVVGGALPFLVLFVLQKMLGHVRYMSLLCVFHLLTMWVLLGKKHGIWYFRSLPPLHWLITNHNVNSINSVALCRLDLSCP